ncbi:hypothetical protein, partial [Enterococcus faecium]
NKKNGKKTGRMDSLFFHFWEVKTKLFTCKPPINPIKWCKEKIFHSIPSFKKKHNMISIYVSMNFVTFLLPKNKNRSL